MRRPWPLLLLLAACGQQEARVVDGVYDGGFPERSHYEHLTVYVATEDATGRIYGHAWLRRDGADLSVPVVTGAALGDEEDEGRSPAVMLLLQHDGLVSTLYADVGRSGRHLDGVFNGRGGGTTIALRRLRANTVP
jgi:hypothetical protein